MIVVLSPRLAGPLAVAIGGLLKWYQPPDSRVRADLHKLQELLRQTANGGHRQPLFDPAEMLAQAVGMKPLAVTYEVAGALLSRSPRTIQRMVKDGQLRTIGEGAGARVIVASVEDFVARSAGEQVAS